MYLQVIIKILNGVLRGTWNYALVLHIIALLNSFQFGFKKS